MFETFRPTLNVISGYTMGPTEITSTEINKWCGFDTNLAVTLWEMHPLGWVDVDAEDTR